MVVAAAAAWWGAMALVAVRRRSVVITAASVEALAESHSSRGEAATEQVEHMVTP